MTTARQIFMLSASDCVSGKCSVCDNPTTYRYRDASTGCRVGNCCVSDLVRAEAIVVSAFGHLGLRHPTIEESAKLRDH